VKRIAVFGTGSALRDLLSLLPSNVEVVGLCDNSSAVQGSTIAGIRVYAPAEIAGLPYDRFVIAARDCDSIRDQLIALGVDANRISALYPSYSRRLSKLVNEDIDALNRDCSLNLPAAGIATTYLAPVEDPGLRAVTRDDFVRRRTLQLVANQIQSRGVEGAVAELGVYRGEFAALLNQLFLDRPLHLFDTFEGFVERDLGVEQHGGFSQSVPGEFRDTSLEHVMSRMQDPSKVHIHKGFFPDSARGLDATFALVSLDVDLYAPTFEGLSWFYPRLVKGGFLFVHDYDNRRFRGVRAAVEAFAAQSDVRLLPLPDFAGSVVLLK